MSFQFQPIELSGYQSLHYSPVTVDSSTSNDVLLDIKQQLLAHSWPTGMQKYVDQIVDQIDLFTDSTQEGGTPQDDLPSLQSYVHLYVKELFDSWIYQVPGVSVEDVNTLFDILQFEKALIPPTAFPGKDELPPSTPGMIPYLLKNLKETDAIVLQGNSGDQRYEAKDLPRVNGVPYVNIAYGYSGRLCISNGKNQQDFHTWPFLELTITPDGQVWTNFTGVDAIATLPMTLQRVGDNERKSLSERDPGLCSGIVGINQPLAAVALAIQAYYKVHDTTPGQKWLQTMFNPDGSIKSGKYMNDPVITSALSDYLNIILNYYNESNPMYFVGDGNAGVCSGYFKLEADGLKFLSKNPQDSRTFTQKMPALTNMNAWISGGEGDWDISPIVHDPSGKDITDWNQRNANWGVAKGLTGLINTGLAYDRIGTPTNPMGGGNWVTPVNIANRGKKSKKGETPFSNLYAAAAQKGVLCNAYVSDFGDDLGADGTLVGKAGDNDCIIVTLYYQE